jgi:hypothetical protein
METPGGKGNAQRVARLLVLSLAFFGLADRAEAQIIQNCQPDQYLDRTAADADRTLTWDFSIVSDPERCLQVRVGQTVTWSGDLSIHPLGAQGGDSPNPIANEQLGQVTFTTVGTFGYTCLVHSSMKGAIKVVAATTTASSPVPALSAAPVVALAIGLLASGLVLVRRRRSQAR